MKCFFFVPVILMAVTSPLFASEQFSQSPSTPVNMDSRDLIETGIAVPGSAIHRWMKSHLRGVSGDIPVEYSFHVAAAQKGPKSFVEILLNQDSSMKDTVILDDDPGEPSGVPNGIPSPASTSDTCARMTVGGSSAVGSATFTWSYQNTRDSNGDGKKDTDPKWVLTGFSVTNIQFLTEGAPIPC